MRSKLFSSVPIAMVAVLVLSMMAILPVFPVATTMEVRDLTDATNVFNFDTATTPLLTEFKVVVWVKNVIDLFAFQVAFKWDASQLTIVKAERPTTDPKYVYYGYPPENVTAVGPTYYADSVVIGATLMAGSTSFSGSGKLAVITLKITATPPKLGVLTSALDLLMPPATFECKLKDSTGTAIPFTDVDGTYKYTWSEPATRPYFKIVPPTTTFGPYPPSAVGAKFSVAVKIMQLDAAWGLIDADMQIQFNSTLIDFVDPNVTWNPIWTTKGYKINYPAGLANIILNVTKTAPPPSGDVVVGWLNFTVKYQGVYPAVDISPLHFIPSQCVLYDPPGPAIIPQAKAPEDGQVVINGIQAIKPPWLEVEPASITLGPDLVVGTQFVKRFDVNINIRDLDIHWNLIGLMFRLTYNPTLVKVVAYKEGPFLPAFNNTYPPPYTYPIYYPAETYPVANNFLFGDIILPPTSGPNKGRWTIFPYTAPLGKGTLLTITFEPIKQSWVDTYTFGLNLFDIKMTGIKDPTKPVQEIWHVMFKPPTNGTVTILPIAAVGRRIDVCMQYPAPYGGQGLNQPADLVVPQQEIRLNAKVTYNWWPVAQKKVTFNIYDSNWNIKAVLESISGDDGHAYATFRMPWPNVNPESLFGVWHIWATVSVADVTVWDTMDFHYDYLVRTWSVTTDKLEYMHLETVKITVKYGTHAIQPYTVVLSAVIQDNLGVPVGIALLSKAIGGSTFSVYKNYTDTVSIVIPWWAYAGSATVRVNFLDKSPIITASATAVTPEKTKGIYILPL